MSIFRNDIRDGAQADEPGTTEKPDLRNEAERLIDLSMKEVEKYFAPEFKDRGQGALHDLKRHMMHYVTDAKLDLQREMDIEARMCDDCPGRKYRKSK